MGSLSGLHRLLKMAPHTHSVINMYTIDPDLLCRKPVFNYNGFPSNKHIIRLKNVEGPSGNACFLFYGKVVDCFLRKPASSHNALNVRHRGMFITAYKANLKRLQGLIAHVTGQREAFVFPYGSSKLALTQIPDHQKGRDTDWVSADADGMRCPLYWQDASSHEPFNFKFPINASFNQKGKQSFLIPTLIAAPLLTSEKRNLQFPFTTELRDSRQAGTLRARVLTSVGSI